MRHPAVANLSHPPATVPAMGSLLSGVIAQLPLLAVVIGGFVVVGVRRAQIGARSALLARLGLAVLAVDLVLQGLWTVTLPRLISSLDMNYSRFGMFSFGVGLILTILYAAAIALLIAAIVTRSAPAPGPHGVGSHPAGSPGRPAQAPYPPRPGAGPAYGTSPHEAPTQPFPQGTPAPGTPRE